MNRRSFVVAICVIAIAVGTLSFGRTMRFGPTRSQDDPKPQPTAGRKRGGVTASLDQNKQITTNAPTKTNDAIPDEIVYGSLFRSILMFKEKAAEEEKQGRLGTGYTKAIQETLKIDDATAKALEEAAAAWNPKKEEMSIKAEVLMAKRSGPTIAGDGENQIIANAETQLQQVYEQMNESILTARDDVRANLSDEQFAALEKAIDANVTSRIDSKPFDPNDESTVKTKERVLPRPQHDVPANVPLGTQLTVKHERPPVSTRDIEPEPELKKGKRGTLNTAGETASVQSSEQPASLFNFCFFGGVVFYGTFVWLVPSIDRVVQVSFTQLDFCAGLHGDPYVYAELFSSFGAFTNADSMGRSFIRPAVVELNVLALPSQVYGAYAEHWVLDCNEICGWILIDFYTIFFQLPQCVSGPSSGFAANFDSCPGPSPQPTPTPTVTIDAVGFTGDFPLRQWNTAVVLRKRIDFPDGSEPTWSRASDPQLAVAYKRGASLSMFATFGVNPASSISRPAQIRVKRGASIVATKTNIDIGGGRSVVHNIIVPYANLESASVVKRSDYEFTWEVSFDGGSNWQNAGKSGSHKIYWLWDNPLTDLWRNQSQTNQFPVNDGMEVDTLYDEALQRSAAAAEGKGTVDEIVANVTKRLASQLIYDPCGGIPVDHPLIITSPPHKGQCSSNANLLRGLLRSIGIDARTNYYWGGLNSNSLALVYQFVIFPGQTMQVKRNAQNEGANNLPAGTCPNVEANPHFSFHALVEVAGKVYDPSYGLTNQSPTAADSAQVTAIEVSRFPDSGFFIGSQVPADRLVTRTLPPSVGQDTMTQCDHTLDVPLGPNPIDNAEFYVGQHYLDFLNRVADADGLAFWTGGITQCGGNVPCIEDKRVHTSLAFFLSIEYQERGYFVHRFYKAAYGRNPFFSEFLTEVGKISPDFASGQMDVDKSVYGREFVETQAYKERYPFDMTFTNYVDTLFANAGITPDPTVRANLINGLSAGTENRASVLRQVVDNETFRNAEFRRAFVEMCYFGYLRRDPDPSGFQFWLDRLNESNGDIYHAAKAFIWSTEYRARFGQP